MTGRRSSARLAAQSQTSSPPQPKPAPSGKKRKNEAAGFSPSAKRGKKDAEPEQKTLEETMHNGSTEPPSEEKPGPAISGNEGTQEPSQGVDKSPDTSGETKADQVNGHATEAKAVDEEPKLAEKMDIDTVDETKPEEVKEETKPEEVKEETKPEEAKEETKPEEVKEETAQPPIAEHEEPKHAENMDIDAVHDTKPGAAKDETFQPPIAEHEAEKKEEAPTQQTNGSAVVPDARESDPPSTILEKGVIYFFFRARVNVDDPQDIKDVARTYLVLRPIPLDAKLGEGPIGDSGNCRLLALPKKVLPTSGKDRFLTFVEKSKTGFSDLKESFMKGSDYATKTAGTSHSPPVTPLAEGVYAITSTGRESHLAYILNIPSELGQVQKDLGLQERGSFITSVKNPTQPAPSYASLPKGPEYPQEIIDEFRNLRWKPLEPKYLDYDNTQVLLIGGSYDQATEQRPKDEREHNGAPREEMDKLEGEDEIRIKHLNGDDAVFADLGITSKEFPKVPTTW